MATATLISFACRALQLPYVRTYQSRQPMQARRAGELPIRIREATPCRVRLRSVDDRLRVH